MLDNSKKARSIHNAYTYLSEIEKIRSNIKEGTFNNLMYNRFNSIPLFKKLFQDLERLCNKPICI